jgi:hypothetical protein
MSIKINLGEILTKSWKIIWKFKVLWIFGILAGCGGANGNRFNYNSGSGNSGGSSGSTGSVPEPFRRFMDMQPEQAMREFLGQYAAIIVGVILLLCVLWFLFYFLGMMGKTGLIKGASKADGGAESMSFAELWTESTPYFWRMFGLNLLIGLPFFLLFVILLAVFGFAGFAAFRGGMSNVGIGVILVGMLGVFFAVICVISILSLIVGMVVEQVQNAIVLEDLGVFPALSRGWEVFKSGVLSVVVIAIILGIISWIIGLIIAIPLIAIIIPVGIGMIAAGTQNFFVPLVLGGCCFIIYLPILLTANGILTSYAQSVWTLTYRRLTAPALPASVEALPAGQPAAN